MSYTLLSPWLRLRPTDLATSFDWARTRYTVEAAAGHFDPIGLLAETTDLALRPAAEPAVEPDRPSIAATLARALDDPGATADAPALRLVGPYFKTFEDAKGGARKLGPDDLALMLRLIADPRVTRFHGLWGPIHALGSEAGVLRAPMVARVLGAAIPDGRWAAEDLGRDLGAMPAGTYAVLSPGEEQLLADPVRRRWAPRLIERQTERGAAAAPGLVRIIAQSYEELKRRRADRQDRSSDGVIDALAARKALCLIGPAASSVLADFEAVLASGTIPAYSLEDWVWSFTLARLGKPVADLAKPEHSRLTRDEFVSRTEFALRHFNPNRCG
ncbi:hypothetical protein [Methylobacterium sp. J-077]|uniref:hypothetical protein n=1 Tax=Methylobacterium sp. J-077 TaxID=2836656 RepID=UPI001FBB04BE|nr:hypothetical protein [Methylobacterium sp. J-077]MCJ2121796.1 hypothetical protein [Methylobacterium sp. J-077]